MFILSGSAARAWIFLMAGWSACIFVVLDLGLVQREGRAFRMSVKSTMATRSSHDVVEERITVSIAWTMPPNQPDLSMGTAFSSATNCVGSCARSTGLAPGGGPRASTDGPGALGARAGAAKARAGGKRGGDEPPHIASRSGRRGCSRPQVDAPFTRPGVALARER